MLTRMKAVVDTPKGAQLKDGVYMWCQKSSTWPCKECLNPSKGMKCVAGVSVTTIGHVKHRGDCPCKSDRGGAGRGQGRTPNEFPSARTEAVDKEYGAKLKRQKQYSQRCRQMIVNVPCKTLLLLTKLNARSLPRHVLWILL